MSSSNNLLSDISADSTLLLQLFGASAAGDAILDYYNIKGVDYKRALVDGIATATVAPLVAGFLSSVIVTPPAGASSTTSVYVAGVNLLKTWDFDSTQLSSMDYWKQVGAVYGGLLAPTIVIDGWWYEGDWMACVIIALLKVFALLAIKKFEPSS